MPLVSIVRCDGYGEVKNAVKRSLELIGGLGKIIKGGKTVLIKPNLIDPFPPETAATTHPLFVKAAIELVQESGSIAWVGDCSGGAAPGTTEKVFRLSGVADVCKETGAAIKDFQKTAFIPKDIPGYKVLERTDFALPIFEADLVINLPKLKTHGLTSLTGAIKNMFGCIHPLERAYLHKNFPKREDFSNGIVDVFSLVRPQLNIMDAVVGMEGDGGPSNGDPKQVGLVIASEDAVALDAMASKVVGYNPTAIPTTRLAMERGLGVSRPEEIEVVGENVGEVCVKDFKLHSLAGNKYKKLNGFGSEFVLNPDANKDKCSRCGTCARNCPAGAITLKPFPEIERDKCIHCYCCNELCPQGAYALKKEWLTDKRKPYLVKAGSSFILADNHGNVCIPGRNFIVINPSAKIHQLRSAMENTEGQLFISFRTRKKDMGPSRLRAVFSFFKDLQAHGRSFSLTRPLPPCILKDASFKRSGARHPKNAPASCATCLEFFIVGNDCKVSTCTALKKQKALRLADFESRERLWERLKRWNFEGKQDLNPKCAECVYRVRGQCCAEYSA